MPAVHLTHRSPNRRDAAVAPKIETQPRTKTLRFRCPNTGREVDSGISARRSTHLISIRVRCPICEDLHEWQVADESPGTALSTDDRSNGARFIEPHSATEDFQGPRAEIAGSARTVAG